MKNYVQIAKKAAEFRRLGFSYTDIANELKISKASVSGWLKNLKLTESEKSNLQRNLKSKKERGKLKASISIRARKIFKEKVAYENAEKEYAKFIKDPLFSFGIGLYWVHGLKKGNHFQFSSSDAEVVKLMVTWLKRYLGIPVGKAKYRVFVDLAYKSQDPESFWVKSVDIPKGSILKTAYTPASKARRNKEYRGSLSIIIGKIEVLRKIIAWQKLLIRYHS